MKAAKEIEIAVSAVERMGTILFGRRVSVNAAGVVSLSDGKRGLRRMYGPVAVVLLLLVASPGMAHHSAAAEYRAEVKTWRGTITRFSWMNPHTWVYFDMTDASGKVTHMECEGSSPNGLIRNGWIKDTLRPGEKVIIEGYPAKDRDFGCKVRDVILPDGRRMSMAGAEEGVPGTNKPR